MKSVLRNLILVLALAAVILMIIGIFLYDYIPTSTTVGKANEYTTESSTTKLLATITEENQTLFKPSDNSSGSTTTTPNIVLNTYKVTKNDLAVYKSSGAYESGRADPFAEVQKEADSSLEDGSNTTSQGGTTGNTSSGSTTNSSNSAKPNVPDGTLFNSTTSK